jgi:hypothetical protein
MQSFEVTEDNFKKFVALCKFWKNHFGLFDFHIHYYHEKFDDAADLARTLANSEDRTAAVAINNRWLIPVTDEEIQRVALHEMMHVLLADLSEAAEQRIISERELKIVIEAAVLRLERILNLFSPVV